MKFEVYKGKDNRPHWRLRAANGEIVAHCPPGGYADANSCQNGIALVQRGASSADVVPVEE